MSSGTSPQGSPVTTGDGDPAEAPVEGDEPFAEEGADKDDDADLSKVDEESAESFPSSDPPSSWAGDDSTGG
jgi:hypothetical protein